MAHPFMCPSRKTCSTPGDIICPDKTCQSSEVDCNPSVECRPGTLLCPDQTCIMLTIPEMMLNET